MLKTFGLAAATLLFVTTADTSFAAPMARAGFGGHGGMMGGPRFTPRLGTHPGHGFIHGDHDFHHDHNFFHGDHNRRLPVWYGGWGWPYGWWPDNYQQADVYPAESEAAYPPPQVSQPPAPPPCPELLHWDPKLGHATREKLCDEQ